MTQKLVALNKPASVFLQLAKIGIAVLCLICNSASHADAKLKTSGNIALEARYFEKSSTRPELARSNVSLSIAPEVYYRFANSKDSLRFSALLRADENDPQRSHADIRELKWHKVERDWELTLGIDTVFWGVTETLHLVNVINQVDQVENIDQEDYLGQPMAHLALIRDWGTLDLFALPYFRERPYPGRNGRPGSGLRVSNDSAIYESSAERWRG
ncbi:MAG: hypothetical protein HKO07_08675, partial [Pseudomonadales bacterium]|nr:hypothetical protein [Pseudomonadales bacterium]